MSPITPAIHCQASSLLPGFPGGIDTHLEPIHAGILIGGISMKLSMSFIAALALVLGACTSPSTPTPAPVPAPVVAVGCQLETSLVTVLASNVATTLTCSNLSAIQTDMQMALGKANLCAPNEAQKAKFKGVVGNLACPLAVEAVLGMLASKIPAGWGCAPGSNPAGLGDTLTAACQKAVTF